LNTLAGEKQTLLQELEKSLRKKQLFAAVPFYFVKLYLFALLEIEFFLFWEQQKHG